MSKHLTVIMGKSLSGKSYVLENIKAEIGSKKLNAKALITHTTRPKRAGELDSINYYFDTNDQFENYKKNNEILVPRDYHVANGDTWHYYLTKQDLKNLQGQAYVILDLKGYLDLINDVNQYNNNSENNKIDLDAIYLNISLATRLERYLDTIRQTDDEREFVRRLYDDTFNAFNDLNKPNFIREHHITVVSSTDQALQIVRNKNLIN